MEELTFAGVLLAPVCGAPVLAAFTPCVAARTASLVMFEAAFMICVMSGTLTDPFACWLGVPLDWGKLTERSI